MHWVPIVTVDAVMEFDGDMFTVTLQVEAE